MRLPGSEKLEIIRLVEQSHLPARRHMRSWPRQVTSPSLKLNATRVKLIVAAVVAAQS